MSNVVAKVLVRQEYGYDTELASILAGEDNHEASLTVQSDKEDADINTIVKRFGLTGVMPSSPRVPTFGDFTEVIDYQSALNAVRQAAEGFMELPADVRSRFDNDPQLYMEFCTATNSEGKLVNIEEMRRIGLAVAEEVEDTPMRVEVVNTAPVPAEE